MPTAHQSSSPLLSASEAEQTAVYLLTHLDQVAHYILAQRFEELAWFADYLHADVPPAIALTDPRLYRILRQGVTNAHLAGFGSLDGAHLRAMAVNAACKQ